MTPHLPIEIWSVIESFCDIYTQMSLLKLNAALYRHLLPTYMGVVVYSHTSNLVYDSYKITIHRSIKHASDYVRSHSNSERPVTVKKCRFTSFGKEIANTYKSMRIYDEYAYIASS